MNPWDYNEVTQADLYDFKACKHSKTGEIYGIKDSSTCQSGKEISNEDYNKLAQKARSGDKEAAALVDKINKAEKKQRDDARVEKQKAEAEKKKKEAEAAEKGKKGKGKKGGGKGKKGGGKGKKGGGKGGGKGGSAAQSSASRAQMSANAKKAQQKAAAARAERAKAVRSRISELQKTLRQIKNPEVRKALEQQISDALKSVNDLVSGKQSAADTPQPGAPAAPKKEG